MQYRFSRDVIKFPQKNWQIIMENKCIFCIETNNEQDDFKLLFEDYDLENRFLYNSDSFYVKPTVGCIVDGYLLVISKKHIPSTAEASPENLSEVYSIIERLKEVFFDKYQKNVLIYEHGPSECRVTGSCIDHMHLHFVPMGKNQIHDFFTLAKEKFDFTKIDDLSGLEKNKSYLYRPLRY